MEGTTTRYPCEGEVRELDQIRREQAKRDAREVKLHDRYIGTQLEEPTKDGDADGQPEPGTAEKARAQAEMMDARKREQHERDVRRKMSEGWSVQAQVKSAIAGDAGERVFGDS